MFRNYTIYTLAAY